MKKTLPSLVIALSLSLTSCSGDADNSTAAPTTVAVEQSSKIDLKGQWRQISDKNDVMVARINENTINIDWSFEDGTSPIYWVGTFTNLVEEGQKITSVRDKIATDMSIMAAQVDQKDFTYKDGKLTFKVAIQDEEFTVEMERTGDLESEDSVTSSANDYKLEGNSFTTPEATFTITNTRTFQPGEGPNQYGTTPIFVVYYDMTNNTDEAKILDFFGHFKAIQDNNTNKVNKLEPGGYIADDGLAEANMDEIKPGGTVSAAQAFELTDTTTSVDLVATAQYDSGDIGTITYPLGQ